MTDAAASRYVVGWALPGEEDDCWNFEGCGYSRLDLATKHADSIHKCNRELTIIVYDYDPDATDWIVYELSPDDVNNSGRDGAYRCHVVYETLHPFTDGNGRSGRAVWLRQMGWIVRAPLGFLHHFYYQTLQNSHP